MINTGCRWGAKKEGKMPDLSSIAGLNIEPVTVALDIDQSSGYYPTATCFAAGQETVNDAVSIRTATINDERAIRFRFKSETDESGSLFGSGNGDFSKYAIYITQSGRIFADDLTTTGIENTKLQNVNRVVLIMAQSLQCYAMTLANNELPQEFKKVHDFAMYLETNRNQFESQEASLPSEECSVNAWDVMVCGAAREYEAMPIQDF